LGAAMPHERDLRFRRVRFTAALRPCHDTGPLLLRNEDGSAQFVQRGIDASFGDTARIDMPYPAAPPEGLTARRWTALWPLARSRSATLADMALASFPALALLLPYLLLAAPGGLVRVGLIASAICLFFAAFPARQRLERNETIRIHARFWDRIVRTSLPTADAGDLSDNAMQRAFMLERGLSGALALAAERRNCIAPATVIAIAALLILPDHTFRLLFAVHIPVTLGMAFLLEGGLLALGQRTALALHDLSRLERQVAIVMPMLRQHGVALQKSRELAARHLEIARRKRACRLLQTAADAAPFWLALTGVATALTTGSPPAADMFSGLLLLLPAIWCAADAGRRLARIRHAGQLIQALKPLELERPSHAAEEFTLGSIESVRLEAVGFRYELDTPPIVTDFSIAISRGDIIALTGASGSGKSTLLNILMGLTAPQDGRIVINGVPCDWKALSGYRTRIAGILQDTPIGLASIRGVIGQNAPMAREADILQAAADAGLAKAIAALPMGMQSLVAEGGFPQSLCQQLLIARALAQRPDLLVLDETFSTLDRELVETILAAVRRRGIALVFVTHRADLSACADRTISLDTLPASIAPSTTQQVKCAP